ncbi:telomeric repeat-binding factor 1 [Chanos chanos]|uniref:Telomeric repeat-binding factor n=1 Tax=Chanos chanos TaxID=29144 RepID=A0A6J2UVR1_CHACN|nr:telomeric repeat-binding factor 1 [Chanos chanos]
MDEDKAEDGRDITSNTFGDSTVLPDAEFVAKSWMMDFLFLSLCRYYRERNPDKFSETLRTFEVMIDGEHRLQDHQECKRAICCFLARIMDAKNLDVQYEKDVRITPLTSALKVWQSMRDIINDEIDETVFENIRCLLIVQSVGVCLEKGNTRQAKETLRRLEKKCDVPEKLQMRLSTVISKNDSYDPLLVSFSHSRLLESVDTFLEGFLKDHPSDFLLKAASRVVHARQERMEKTESEQDYVGPSSREDLQDWVTAVLRLEKFSWSPRVTPRNDDKTVPSGLRLRPKKKLLSTRNVEPWKPDTAKKDSGVTHRKSSLKVSRISFDSETPQKTESKPLAGRSRRMWTYEEDKALRRGVLHYGEGKWAKILQEFDFGDRTSVMLKDRWRTLKRKHL